MRPKHFKMMLTEHIQKIRSARNEQNPSLRTNHLMPQQVATGVVMRHTYRDQQNIQFLYKQGVSVNYPHTLQLEKRLANTALENLIENGGYYIPNGLVMGRHIFFAADNVDYREDTPKGQNITHEISWAVYQRIECDDPSLEITISEKMKKIPDTIFPLHTCSMPKKPKPLQPEYPDAHFESENPASSYHQKDIILLLAKALVCNRLDSFLSLVTTEQINQIQ